MPRDSSGLQPSAIVITIAGLGARWLGAWGCGSAVTPVINRFAAESILWDHAFALHSSPVRQFVEWTGGGLSAPGGWLSLLGHQGRTTVLMTDCPEAAACGEAHFGEVIELQPASKCGLSEGFEETHFGGFMAGAAELLQTVPPAGSLVWLHTAGLHLPWDAPLEWRMEFCGEGDPDPPPDPGPPAIRLWAGVQDATGPDPAAADLIAGWQQACLAQLRVIDEGLAVLLEALEVDGADRGPLVALAGCDGWALGEHGWIGGLGEGPGDAYDEFLHIPMLARFPVDGIGCRRSAELVSADRLGAILAAWLDGGSIHPGCRPPILPDHARRVLWRGSREKGVIRTAAWKLVVHGSRPPELFVKPDDRWDQNDVASRCPLVVEALLELFAGMPGGEGGELDVNEAGAGLDELLVSGVS